MCVCEGGRGGGEKKFAMKFRRRHGVKEIEVIGRVGVSLTGIPLRLSKVGCGWVVGGGKT